MKIQIPSIAECLVLAAAHSALAEFDIRDFGAAETNSAAENAAAIQKAIDAAGNGGAVIIPAGTFVSGTLWLRPHVELHLADGAVLKASPNLSDYNPLDAYPENWGCPPEYWNGCHFIIARHADGASITGTGRWKATISRQCVAPQTRPASAPC
ncbi:MAG: hypothetical protein ILM98_00195 [Kiritimatiellae bacterium]|nr:hypothetical protein [Kiritimatiellia bacterium]